MVGDRDLILDPLRSLGVEPGDVTDVMFNPGSHYALSAA
jgi:hypothetical protein